MMNVWRREDKTAPGQCRELADMTEECIVSVVGWGDVVRDHAWLVLPDKCLNINGPVSNLVRQHRHREQSGLLKRLRQHGDQFLGGVDDEHDRDLRWHAVLTVCAIPAPR